VPNQVWAGESWFRNIRNVEHNSGLTKEPNERFHSEKPFTIRGLHYFGLAKRIHSDFYEQFFLRKGIVKAAAV
jgi:hypothetical protein